MDVKTKKSMFMEKSWYNEINIELSAGEGVNGMKISVTIQEKLKDLRKEKELSLEQLSEQVGISKSALGNYESNDYKDISHYSIITLAKFYGVSTDYLFGLTDDENHPNADVSELHLSGEMIDLLKSGRINNRLLCEMAAHKDFVKMLADIEIYIDGIASMQIKNLNDWVGVARDEIIQKYNPGDDDPHMRIMNAANIDEDEYFRNMIHGDVDGIIKDIREAHKNDTESAPDTTPIMNFKKGMDVAANFKGSPMEKQIAVLLGQIGVDFKKLSDEELRTLVKILNKSNLIKTTLNNRGKRRKK